MKGMFCDACGTCVDIDRDPEALMDTSGHNYGPWECICWFCRNDDADPNYDTLAEKRMDAQ